MIRLSKSTLLRSAGVGCVAAVFAAACGSAAGTAAPKAKPAGAQVVTFADLPSSPPLSILPLQNSSNFSVINISQFSEEFYRPLYWFGDSGVPKFNPQLSMANAPVFTDNNQTATITLKHWLWSNGQPVTARDVVFWMNLLSAVTDPNAPVVPGPQSGASGPGWGAEVPGGFPSNVVSYTQTGPYSIVFHFNHSYNQKWLLYNELSQITPMPQASWDKLSASGAVGDYDASAEARSPLAGTTPTQYFPTNPGTATTGALGVAAFLNAQDYQLSTYSTNPLWKVVDGPYFLSTYTTGNVVEMTPNPKYSGSPKPTVDFEMLPFTSDSAEFDELKTGQLSIGYLPLQDISQAKALEKQFGYKEAPWLSFSIGYFAINLTNPAVRPLFSQLYFREALQYLIDQEQYIKDLSYGVGSPSGGPVPVYPKNNPDESPLEGKLATEDFNPTKAVSLLKDHGWKVKPGGLSYCAKPGTASNECGAGIKKGMKANLSMQYASGFTVLTNQIQAMKSEMQQKAGIDVSLTDHPFQTVISTTFAGCTTAKPCRDWEMSDWGFEGNWTFAPDYYPTGGEIFSSGAASNAGDFTSNKIDQLINATHDAISPAAETKAMFAYENYVAKEFPVIWMPFGPYQITMYKKNLSGVVPQDPYLQLTPEKIREK